MINKLRRRPSPRGVSAELEASAGGQSYATSGNHGSPAKRAAQRRFPIIRSLRSNAISISTDQPAIYLPKLAPPTRARFPRPPDSVAPMVSGPTKLFTIRQTVQLWIALSPTPPRLTPAFRAPGMMGFVSPSAGLVLLMAALEESAQRGDNGSRRLTTKGATVGSQSSFEGQSEAC